MEGCVVLIPFKKNIVESEAKFSIDERHRYFLKKVWNSEGDIATVIMLNPTEKADALRFDRSVMLMNNYFAEQIVKIDEVDQHVYGGFIVVNLFSYRSKNEKKMLKNTEYSDRFDKDTDDWISKAVNQSKDVYIAWGSNKDRKKRVKTVQKILQSHKYQKVYKLKKQKNKNVHPSKYSGDLQFEQIKVSDLI